MAVFELHSLLLLVAVGENLDFRTVARSDAFTCMHEDLIIQFEQNMCLATVSALEQLLLILSMLYTALNEDRFGSDDFESTVDMMTHQWR